MKTKLLIFSVLAIFLFAGNAMAVSINDMGMNITVEDGQGSGSGWHGAQEDNETEPGTQIHQKWDLEAIFWNDSKLFIVGGYNFINGEGGYMPGDVFLGSGDGNYQYLVDFDLENNGGLSSGSFEIFENYTTEAPQHIPNSDPWRGSGEGLAYATGGSYTVHTAVTDSPFSDGEDNKYSFNRYALEIDFSATGFELAGLFVHNTYQCGNDEVEGKIPVPEPGTLLLVGFGLIGMAAVGRKNFIKM